MSTFVFIGTYAINVGRFLVQGVEVWLNNLGIADDAAPIRKNSGPEAIQIL